MARKRGNGSAVALVVLLLVGVLVAIGLYLGDAYVLRRTERAAAGELQGQLGTPTAPAVDIEGRPFLTQAVGRRLRTVHVVADDVGTASTGSNVTTVPVQHVDLVLSDVTTTDWYQTMKARRVDGTALLAYSDLGTLSSVPLTYAGGGRLQAEQKVTIIGANLTATVTGTPQLDVGAQTITLGDPQISLGSVNIPQGTADALLRTIVKPIQVDGLPFGLTLSSVSAEDDALHAGLQGGDVTFSR